MRWAIATTASIEECASTIRDDLERDHRVGHNNPEPSMIWLAALGFEGAGIGCATTQVLRSTLERTFQAQGVGRKGQKTKTRHGLDAGIGCRHPQHLGCYPDQPISCLNSS